MNEYEDMLLLPHHESKKHPRMSLHDRAAQFSPFAALTGYEAVLGETARLTEDKHLIDEHRWEELQADFRALLEMDETQRIHTSIEVTHFQKDQKKEGGAYRKSVGYLCKIDFTRKMFLLSEGEWIAFEDLYDVHF